MANALYSEVGLRVSTTCMYLDKLITPEATLSYTNKSSRNGSIIAGLIGEPGNFSVTNNTGTTYQISSALGFLVRFRNGGFVKTYLAAAFGPGYQAGEFNLLAGIDF